MHIHHVGHSSGRIITLVSANVVSVVPPQEHDGFGTVYEKKDTTYGEMIENIPVYHLYDFLVGATDAQIAF